MHDFCHEVTMNTPTHRRTLLGVSLVFLLFFPFVGHRALGQDQLAPRQPGSLADPIRELNLTPEQREQIRGITERTRAERREVRQRLRQSYRALYEALDSDNPDEATIEQLLKECSDAQASSMKLRVLNEVRIRKVLKPDQIKRLRELRRQFRRDRWLGPMEPPEESHQ